MLGRSHVRILLGSQFISVVSMLQIDITVVSGNYYVSCSLPVPVMYVFTFVGYNHKVCTYPVFVIHA